MNTKTCPACQQEKPLDSFYKSKKRIHSWCKKCLCENHNKRWIERKIEAMKLFDSKCCKCGYCKNYAALEFHHLDPKEKDFVWVKLRQMKWSQIVCELKKCVLLCANCHREEHWPNAIFENYKDAEVKTFLDRTFEIKPTGSCPQCGEDVYRTKYCSVECSSMSKRKAKRPSKEELAKLLEEKTVTAIALSYKVTGNAVKKWAKSYQIW
jgi:hypothetical protein